MKDEYALLVIIWIPFLLTFIGSFLPDPLFVHNIGPDFGLERFITFPNLFRMLWPLYLNPFVLFANLFLSIIIVTENRKRKKMKEK
jgi:hypothetical protein